MTNHTGEHKGTIVFDLDGTLVDSVPDLAGALDGLMMEMGLPAIGVPATRKLIGHGIVNLVRGALTLRAVEWQHDQALHAITRFTELYSERLSWETRPYPDAEQTLSMLADDGWRLAVCTNKIERYAKSILDNLGLAHFFPVIAGPDTFGVAKPDPRHLLETASHAGGGDRIIFVGDSEVDIATAKAAGVPVIAVSYGYAKTPLAALLPEALVDRFSDIPKAIEDIAKECPS